MSTDHGPTRVALRTVVEPGLRDYLAVLSRRKAVVIWFTVLVVGVAVASGLVQIDLGDETPVMRAGDAALATTTAVHGWRNLTSSGSTFFWVLRDPLLPEG